MQIGFSFIDLALGGAQAFYVQLAQGLAARGHRLNYWLAAASSDRTHVTPALCATLDAVAQRVSQPWDLWAADVIHLDGYHGLLRKVFYLPRWRRCVETYHSTYSVRRSGPLYPPHRVAISRAVQAYLPGPTQCIYQGVPLPALISSTLPRFDVAILGRIHPVKNHSLFLQVCAELYRQRGACTALVIGGHPQTGPYQQAIDAEIAHLQAQGVAFYLTGDVAPETVSDWLAQARVLLVTSQSEGFGRMAVEAMAAGIPVVANPVGGLLEIVRDGETGFLVERDNVAAFVAATARLLDDEDLRRSMGERGRAVAEVSFSFDAMLTAYEALYRAICSA